MSARWLLTAHTHSARQDLTKGWVNPCGLIPPANARNFLVQLSLVSCSGTVALIVLGGTRCSSDCQQRLLTDVSTFLCGKPCMLGTISLAVRYYFGALKSQHPFWKEERGGCCTRVPSSEWRGEGCQVCCCCRCCDHPDSFSSFLLNIHEPGGVFTLITCWATSNKHLMAGREETKKILIAAFQDKMKSLRCACSLPCWHLSGKESKWTQENVAVWTLNKYSVVLSNSRYSAMVVLACSGTGCSPLFRSSKSLQFAGDGAHTRHCKGPDELSTAQGNPINYISSSFSSPHPSHPHPTLIPCLFWAFLTDLNDERNFLLWMCSVPSLFGLQNK